MNASTSLVRGLERRAGLPTAISSTIYATAGVSTMTIKEVQQSGVSGLNKLYYSRASRSIASIT